MALEDAKEDIDLGFTRTSDRGISAEITFGGALSFLRRRYTKDLAGIDLAVTGIPFDQATTSRPGTRLGPRAIREASALQAGDPPYGCLRLPNETREFPRVRNKSHRQITIPFATGR